MDRALFKQLFFQACDREIHLISTACAVYRNLQSSDFLACCDVARDMDDAYSQFLDRLRPVARKLGVTLDDCRAKRLPFKCHAM